MKRTRLGAVLWDMDGTLVDTEPYWHHAELELVREFGGTWTVEDQASVTGFDLRDAAAVMRDRGGVDLEVDDIVDRMLDLVIAQVRVEIPWRPGSRELLDDLGEHGIPCALVTMSWRSLVDAVLAELPPGSFDVTITGDEVEHGKPHPEPYLTAASALQVDPAECVALEDSPTGVRSASAAGCITIAVPNTVAIEPGDGYRVLSTLVGLRVADLEAFADDADDAAQPQKTPSRSPEVRDGGIGVTARGGADDTPAEGTPSRSREVRDGGIGVTARGGADDTPADPVPTRAARRTRGRRILGLSAAAVVIAAGVVIALTRPTSKTPAPVAPATIAFDAWAPSFLLPDSTSSLTSYGSSLREVMPFWFTLQDPDLLVLDPAVTSDVSAQVLSEAHQHGLRVMPSILDKTSTGTLATLLADTTRRQQHVAAIVALVTSSGYDGIDIDYEQFGYNDPKVSWDSTSADFVTFVGELSTALHAVGKTLSVTVPPIYDAGHTDDSGYWVYDYKALAPLVDRLRILAYDYSVADPGPIAPLSFVRRAIAGARAAVPGAELSKVDLGIALYGYNWLLSTVGTCSADATTGKTNVSQRGIADLLTKRSATPVFDAETGESSFTYQVQYTDGTNACTQTREVHYVDAEGARLRIDLARSAFFGGVALWALGYDSPLTWTTIAPLDAVQG